MKKDKRFRCPKCDAVMSETQERRIYYCGLCGNCYYRGPKGTFQRINFGLWEKVSFEMSPENDYLVRYQEAKECHEGIEDIPVLPKRFLQ